jgi:hypothetical protein
MDKINACLKLCDELTKAINEAERELASKLAARLSELTDTMPHGGPDGDGMVFAFFTLRLSTALSNSNFETATVCVPALQMLLAEEAAFGNSGES